MAANALAVRLPAVLDVDAAEGVRAALVANLDAGLRAGVDGSEVTAVDAAGIQVLCAFAREARELGRTVTWLGASAPLHEVARRLGVAALLGLPD